MLLFFFHFQVTNDLIPFMIILTVIMVGYAVAAQSIAYPNGFYTSETLTLSKFTSAKLSEINSRIQNEQYQVFKELEPTFTKACGFIWCDRRPRPRTR